MHALHDDFLVLTAFARKINKRIAIIDVEQMQRDEALLQQALEALELRCGTNVDERKELIPALRFAPNWLRYSPNSSPGRSSHARRQSLPIWRAR